MKPVLYRLSHHTANVATREQFAGNATAESIARQAGCAEALLLMTCNRVEVYGVSNKWISTDEIGRCLIGKQIAIRTITRLHFYRYEDTKCVQHLFRVASGLDSMVVGRERDIRTGEEGIRIGQNIGSSRSVFASFISNARFAWQNRYATHTDIARGAVSVGSVAVELAQRIFGKLGDCKSACARRR